MTDVKPENCITPPFFASDFVAAAQALHTFQQCRCSAGTEGLEHHTDAQLVEMLRILDKPSFKGYDSDDIPPEILCAIDALAYAQEFIRREQYHREYHAAYANECREWQRTKPAPHPTTCTDD